MISIENQIKYSVIEAVKNIYSESIDEKLIQIQKTKKEFEGDFTIVVFPILKISKKNPIQTATDIGNYLKSKMLEIDSFNVIQAFLNISFKSEFWKNILVNLELYESSSFINNKNNQIVIEYSSPNTNKPLHLGHIRNNLLGHSIAEILKKAGNNVNKVNLINDRGIHICKSMLAWKKWGNNETPESSGIKGDHFVGKYYVIFDKHLKTQILELESKGHSVDEARAKAPLMIEAQQMLLDWENNVPEIINLWNKMNTWVYDGFDITYKNLGIEFDKIYYESETYLLGKEIVHNGLKNNIVFQKEDNSIWINLTEEKLDEKLLLRSDGTSVYMTQDIGTAVLRFNDFNYDKMLYVVGNEQNYHFQVLKIVLGKLGYKYANKLEHLSYGMVELPEGKMKSREGTVVDADDLLDEMKKTAKEISDELGKLDNYSEEEKDNIFAIISKGALKYFILKVDPKKNMTFDPKESIDFNGNTGPFIQYSNVRINSILRKAKKNNIEINSITNINYRLNEKEQELIKLLYRFSEVLAEASNKLSPAIIANYLYELAKEFNQYYQEHSIINAENEEIIRFRLFLANEYSKMITKNLLLLGIRVPERM